MDTTLRLKIDKEFKINEFAISKGIKYQKISDIYFTNKKYSGTVWLDKNGIKFTSKNILMGISREQFF